MLSSDMVYPMGIQLFHLDSANQLTHNKALVRTLTTLRFVHTAQLRR